MDITSIDEVCLARSYDIAKLVNKYKTQDLGLALVEGGATGYFGFAGLPFNLVLTLVSDFVNTSMSQKMF